MSFEVKDVVNEKISNDIELNYRNNNLRVVLLSEIRKVNSNVCDCSIFD